MLFLQVELISMGNFLVCSVLFVAICFNFQSLVFVVQVVQAGFFRFYFTFEIIDSVLLLVEV